jgi:hypothetical protein
MYMFQLRTNKSKWWKVRIFFSDNTRVRIYLFLSRKAQFFFPEFHISLYDQNSESDYFFFPPPKSEYFFRKKP